MSKTWGEPNLKKRLFICLLATIFALLPLPAAAAEPEPNMNLMISLGVFPTDFTDGQAYATRADFITAAVKLFGYAEVAKNCSQQRFDDVAPQNGAYCDINFAAQQGYISGTSERTFSPDMPVTDVQAVKVLLSMLGYDILARQKGGYPSGYILVANQTQLVRGVDFTGGEALTIEQLALLFKNCLSVRLVTAYTAEGKDYFETTDETLLSRFALKKAEGIVETAEAYSVLPGKGFRNSRVQIGGKIYFNEGQDLEPLLGKTVEIYYDDSDGDAVLAAVSEKKNKNSSITLEREDIIKTASAGETLRYEIGEKEETAELSPNMKVVYNGRGLSGYTQQELYPEGARLTLLDNDGDQAYDILFVQDTVIFRVNSINVPQEKIYMDNVTIDGKRELDLGAADAYVIRNSRGEPAALESIEQGSWLSAAVSRDFGVISLVVLDQTVTGTVEAISQNTHSITVDGTEYQVRQEASGAAILPGELRLGSEYTFILDETGKLCRIDDAKAQVKRYGYIIAKNQEGGISQNISLKILTGTTIERVEESNSTYSMQGGASQKISVLKLADKVRLNGSSKLAGEVYSSLPDKSVIEYTLNGTGEIRSMETVTQYYDRGERTANCRSKVFGGVSAGAFGMDEETVVFFVPISGEDDDFYANMKIVDKKNYVTSSFGFDTENFSADACVIELNVEIDSQIQFNDKTPLFALQTIQRGLNEEGEEIFKLYGYLKGEWKELKSRAGKAGLEQELSQLDSGDILYYSTDNRGDVNAVKRIASLNLSDSPYHTGVTGLEESIWGTITNTRSSVLELYGEDYTNNVEIAVGTEQVTAKSAVVEGADCYRFDYAKGTYTPVAFSDLPLYQSGYERVFVYSRSSMAKIIVAVE